MFRAMAVPLILVVLGACSAPPPPVPSVAPASPSAEPVISTGVLTYCDGDVMKQAGSGWTLLDTGAELSMRSVLKTGPDSQCDIQFGTLGVLHLSADTVVDLSRIQLSDSKKAVDLNLITGSVTAKVSKLVGDQRFQVRTATVVAGVRGTRFMVTVKEKGRTAIAVAEGSVALIPPTLDQGAFDNLVQDQAQKDLVGTVVQQLVEAAPVLGVGTEVEVTPESMATASQAMEQVVQTLQSVVAASTPAPQTPAPPIVPPKDPAQPASPTPAIVLPSNLIQALAHFERVAPSSPDQPPRPLSQETQKALEKTVNLEVKESIPVKPLSLETAPPLAPVAPELHPSPSAVPASVSAEVPAKPPKKPKPLPPLKAPKLVSPAKGEVFDIHKKKQLKFSWRPVPEATGYGVRLVLLDAGQDIVVKEWSTAGTEVLFDQFENLKLGPHVWSVTASAPGREGDPIRTSSAQLEFLIDKNGQLSAPTLEFGN